MGTDGNVSNAFNEKSDLEELRDLIIPGVGSDELVLPYIQHIAVYQGRLEKLEKFILTQKQDKKNQLLLGLIKKVS